jgi:hypothetical protein
VLDRIAYGLAECEKEDLSDGEEGSTKDDIANRPPIIEGAEYENELGDDVDGNADERP